MSFNRLNYDTCTYKHILSESVSPGDYMINTPRVSCEPCYQANPYVRLQSSGGSISSTNYLIDVDSELLGLNRKKSNCPSQLYLPLCPNCKANSGEPCGQGVTSLCKNCKGLASALKPGEKCGDDNLLHFKDCMFPTDDSRLSNPACNLRGTGWNRWEWLCNNPQERVQVPFDWNINNRLIVKDNHRACLPKLIDVNPSLPSGREIKCEEITPTCASYTDESSTGWRNCNEIKNY
jgi:hypothetical protein